MIVTPWLIIAQEKHELVLQVYELSQKKMLNRYERVSKRHF